jgi:hypothetical protein
VGWQLAVRKVLCINFHASRLSKGLTIKSMKLTNWHSGTQPLPSRCRQPAPGEWRADYFVDHRIGLRYSKRLRRLAVGFEPTTALSTSLSTDDIF